MSTDFTLGPIPVRITPPEPIRVRLAPPTAPSILVLPVPGPRGPSGPGAGGGDEYVQSTPIATWTIPHELGRRPNVAVYVDGEEVTVDVEATTTQVVVTFPAPYSGTAVLT